MPKAADVLRHLGALVIGVLGTFGVFALSIGMNAQLQKVATEPVAVISTLEAPPPPPRQGPNRPQRTSPVKKARAAPPSASPLLAASLAGLDFGLGSAGDAALSGATAALVGDLGATVLDESQVEDRPVPSSGNEPPRFPARARSLGQSGRVVVAFVVDIDGSVQDVSIVESTPSGVFDDAVLEAVRGWRFEPARHEGNPVAVRVRQPLTFELE